MAPGDLASVGCGLRNRVLRIVLEDRVGRVADEWLFLVAGRADC